MQRTFLCLLIATTLTLLGQDPATPRYEAATIKLNDSGRSGSGMRRAVARTQIVNSTLKFCVQMAFNVKDFQVSGGPSWASTDRYDIEAVAAAPFKPDEERIMLQALLAERFGLVVRHETQNKPGYVLVIAKNGPKLPPPIEDPDIMFSGTPSGDRTLKATNVTTAQLASALSLPLGAIVLDQTGIAQRFDASMQWTPDPSSQAQRKSGEPVEAPADAAQGPSIFTVLQEKLGLKLEAKKIPVDVIVIERANRPSEN